MITAVVQAEQQTVSDTNPKRRSATPAQDGVWARPTAAPEQSHLQAVHASQRGVILRGLRHDTFWEW